MQGPVLALVFSLGTYALVLWQSRELNRQP